jgi:hypothetical protein
MILDYGNHLPFELCLLGWCPGCHIETYKAAQSGAIQASLRKPSGISLFGVARYLEKEHAWILACGRFSRRTEECPGRTPTMLAPEFDRKAFNAVQDELDYAYAVKADREKKRAARAKTKGIKALNIFIAQALLSRRGE